MWRYIDNIDSDSSSHKLKDNIVGHVQNLTKTILSFVFRLFLFFHSSLTQWAVVLFSHWTEPALGPSLPSINLCHKSVRPRERELLNTDLSAINLTSITRLGYCVLFYRRTITLSNVEHCAAHVCEVCSHVCVCQGKSPVCVCVFVHHRNHSNAVSFGVLCLNCFINNMNKTMSLSQRFMFPKSDNSRANYKK